MKKNLLNFIYVMEKRFWGEGINTNRYFASISLLFIALLGAMQGGGAILHSWFNWDVEMSLPSTVGLAIVVFGFNLYESIVSAKPGIAALRSLFVFGCFVVAFVISYILAIVALFAVAALLVLWFVGFALGGGGGRGKSSKTILTDQYGHETEVEKTAFGQYQDAHGRTYTDNQDGTFREN